MNYNENIGNIIDVKQPKRAKRNASFKFQPLTYTYNGRTQKIEDPEFIAKYAEYKELNKAQLATSAATTAGGMIFHIPLLSEGVSFIKGLWKNPENNRLKSGALQVYKDSPLSYIEEGKDVYITRDTMFVLKFKSSKEDIYSFSLNKSILLSLVKNNLAPSLVRAYCAVIIDM